MASFAAVNDFVDDDVRDFEGAVDMDNFKRADEYCCSRGFQDSFKANKRNLPGTITKSFAFAT